ncbi:DNA-3-methyladenine glycosylase I [Flavobacterium sp. W21_SRS_FM6]|uniref:DNA-3-methyladenine glycosylase I n=1 Tax=Flavobacterium sp. W21_SRS_FM6 TaxID=3240268 RepID=UPI003F8DFD9C
MNNSTLGSDGVIRCGWCAQTDVFIPYHDQEWGMPVKDDRGLFEKLCLESFQSGLSWRTILTKRENFRNAFAHFDFNQVALFDGKDVTRLMEDPGIVRHSGKIAAVIHNAQRAKELLAEFGSLANFFWRFEVADNRYSPQSMTASAESITMAAELKKRGWKFVGPTTLFAFMQAVGLINDHAQDCAIRGVVQEAKQNFTRPT